ncbi:MAG: hypothetical protein WDW36_000762 [Sanguina aurantia]
MPHQALCMYSASPTRKPHPDGFTQAHPWPSPRASVNPPPQHQNGWPYLLSSSQTKPPPGHPHSRPNSRQENERGGGAGGCTAAAEGPLRRRARAASSCQVGLQRTCTACAPLVATTVI